MAETRRVVTLEVDMDTGRVAAGAAEIEAYLSAIRDERVNVDIDVDAEDLRALSKTMKATTGDLVALDRYLQKNNATLDRRTKLFKSLHPLTRDFINDNWDALKATEGNEEGVRDLSAALKDSRNAHSALSSTVQDATERQRQYSRGVDKARKVERERIKELEALTKEIEAQDAAYRKHLATQEKAGRENVQYERRMAQLREQIIKTKLEAEKMGETRLAFASPQQWGKIERARTELKLLRDEYTRMGGDLTEIDQRVKRQNQMLANMVHSLSRVRLHLGFFSLSVKQALNALVAFGPAITGLIGAFSALIGVLGVALTGALGLAGAAMGGFILNTLGIGIALKPLINEFSTAIKAANDYQQQVIETGKGSQEAQDALEEYKTTLKNLPPETRKAVIAFQQMRASWAGVTEKLREPFFNLMANGMRTLTSLMPMFQRNTVAAFDAAAQGAEKWLQGLRGNEARSIINALMENFTRATPALMGGIGNLVTAFGRLSKAATRNLPDVMQTFNQWSQGLANRTGKAGFAFVVDDMIEKLRSVGRVLSSAGRMLVTFFTTGADAGQSLTDTLSLTFNRWNSWMKTVEGQKSLKTFFEQSVEEMSNVWHILSPLIKTFLRFVQAIRPVSVALQEVTAGILSVVEAAMSVGVIAKFVAVLVTMRIIRSIGTMLSTAAMGVALLTRQLGLSTAVSTANTAAQAANAGATARAAAAKLGLSAAEQKAAASQAISTAAASASTAAMSRQTLGAAAGMGMMGRFGSFLMGPWGLALGIASTALIFFGDDLASLFKTTKPLEQQLIDVAVAQRRLGTASASASDSVRAAKNDVNALKDSVRDYNKAVEAGKKPAQSWEDIRDQVDATNQSQNQARKSLLIYINEIARTRKTARDAANTALDDLRRANVARASVPSRGAAPPPRSLISGMDVQAVNKRIGLIDKMMNSKAIPSVRRLNQLLRGLNVPDQVKEGLQANLIDKMKESVRAINAARIAAGKIQLPEEFGPEMTKLFKDLPQAARQNLTGVFKEIGPDKVRQITGLLRRLQQAGPGGKRAAVKLGAEITPKNANQSIEKIKQALRSRGLPDIPVKIRLRGQNALEGQLKQITKSENKKIGLRVPNFQDVRKNLKDWAADQETKKVKIEPFVSPTRVPVDVVQNPVKKARGGPVTPDEKPARRAAPGAKVSRATFIAGEENRTEFVIATNPAYRRENIGYLMQAASALNVPFALPQFAAGGATKPFTSWSKVTLGPPFDGMFGTVPQKMTAHITQPGSKLMKNKKRWRELSARAERYTNLYIPWSQGEASATNTYLAKQERRNGALTDAQRNMKKADAERTLALQMNYGWLANKALQSANNDFKSVRNRVRDLSKKKKKSRKDKKDLAAAKKQLAKIKQIRSDYPKLLTSEIPGEIDTTQAALDEINDEIGGFTGGQTEAQGQVALSAARYNLMQQFGSNFVGTGALGGMSFARFSGGGSFAGLTSPAAAAGAGMSGGVASSTRSSAAPTSGGGKTVNITNNYQEPPADPHTWSKQVEWEASVL